MILVHNWLIKRKFDIVRSIKSIFLIKEQTMFQLLAQNRSLWYKQCVLSGLKVGILLIQEGILDFSHNSARAAHDYGKKIGSVSTGIRRTMW